MSEKFQEAAREFLAKNGSMMRNDDGSLYYGWHDYGASYEHCLNAEMIKYYEQCGEEAPPTCHWVIPDGAQVTEETYSMFMGTFVDSEDEVGLNVSPVNCACGKYKNVTLRWVGSLSDLMGEIFGVNHGSPVVIQF